MRIVTTMLIALLAPPASADRAALDREQVAADLATAAWAEISCENRSMDLDVVAALTDRHGISAADFEPRGDLFYTADGQFMSLDLAGIEKGFDVVCEGLLNRYQGGLTDGALIDQTGDTPDLAVMAAVPRTLILGAAARRQETVRSIFAEVAVAERVCGFAANHLMLMILLRNAHLDVEAPGEIDRLRVIATRFDEDQRRIGQEAWCRDAVLRYGADGTMIAGIFE